MPKAISECKPGELLAAALYLAGRGWHVFPLHHPEGDRCSCGDAACDSIGKHPRTKAGFKDGTTDPAVIRNWWGHWPAANVGVRAGPDSGVWMLGPDGEAGIEAITELVRSMRRYHARRRRSRGAVGVTTTFVGLPRAASSTVGIIAVCLSTCAARAATSWLPRPATKTDLMSGRFTRTIASWPTRDLAAGLVL